MPFFASSDLTAREIVYLGGSITVGSGASVQEVTSWRARVRAWLANRPPVTQTHTNAGVGGTTSWYALARLTADVLSHNPDVVFIDFAVNDAATTAPLAGEALVRRILTARPSAKVVIGIYSWPPDYSYSGATQDTWRTYYTDLADHYGLQVFDFGLYLAALLGGGYTDGQVEAYFSGAGNVHPNDAGYAVIAQMIEAGWMDAGFSGALPARLTACQDYEYDEQAINGADLSRSAGWTVNGTAVQSSTPGSTVTWTGTCCSFGAVYTGSIEWQRDGGVWTAAIQSMLALELFARGSHTIALRVVSGSVTINKLLAV